MMGKSLYKDVKKIIKKALTMEGLVHNLILAYSASGGIFLTFFFILLGRR